MEGTQGKDLPAMLVLKRTAIRVFPDGRKVALYFADKINTYIPVPYDSIGKTTATAMSEATDPDGNKESIVRDLEKIVKTGQTQDVVFHDGSRRRINPLDAKFILATYEPQDEAGKQNVSRVINTGNKVFDKVLKKVKKVRD